jgi:hypothetical protein
MAGADNPESLLEEPGDCIARPLEVDCKEVIKLKVGSYKVFFTGADAALKSSSDTCSAVKRKGTSTTDIVHIQPACFIPAIDFGECWELEDLTHKTRASLSRGERRMLPRTRIHLLRF